MIIPNTINSLQILCPSWVGDIVMSSCVWRIARSQYPTASIEAVVRPHLVELLEGVNEIDVIHALDTKKVISATCALKKQGRADAMLLLPNSLRSALIAKMSGIPIRVGYHRNGRGWLLTHAIETERQSTPTPTANYYLRLANLAFGSDETNAMPSIGMSEAQRSNGSSLLNEEDRPAVLLVVGASKEHKRWPAERFAQVADRLTSNGAHCYIIGSPQESDIAQEVIEASTQPMTDLTASGTTLGSLKGIVQDADLMISNDTGPRHLAVATGTPVITLYGPTDFRWTNYDCDADIPILAEPFLPEHYVADHHEKRCAIDKISVGDVIAHAHKLLSL